MKGEEKPPNGIITYKKSRNKGVKENLVVNILIPDKYIGKVELSVNAGSVSITDIENEIIEVTGKIGEVNLQGNKSEIEIDSNLDMQIKLVSHEGALEINQLSATSRLLVPAGYRFGSAKKGIATIIFHLFINIMQEKINMTPETKCIQTIFYVYSLYVCYGDI